MIPVLKRLESFIRPRWSIPSAAAKSLVGITVVLLTVRLLVVPIPLSNVVPAILIAVIALAYLEADGLVLLIGLLAGYALLAMDLWGAQELMDGATRIAF